VSTDMPIAALMVNTSPICVSIKNSELRREWRMLPFGRVVRPNAYKASVTLVLKFWSPMPVNLKLTPTTMGMKRIRGIADHRIGNHFGGVMKRHLHRCTHRLTHEFTVR